MNYGSLVYYPHSPEIKHIHRKVRTIVSEASQTLNPSPGATSHGLAHPRRQSMGKTNKNERVEMFREAGLSEAQMEAEIS